MIHTSGYQIADFPIWTHAMSMIPDAPLDAPAPASAAASAAAAPAPDPDDILSADVREVRELPADTQESQ